MDDNTSAETDVIGDLDLFLRSIESGQAAADYERRCNDNQRHLRSIGGLTLEVLRTARPPYWSIVQPVLDTEAPLDKETPS